MWNDTWEEAPHGAAGAAIHITAEREFVDKHSATARAHSGLPPHPCREAAAATPCWAFGHGGKGTKWHRKAKGKAESAMAGNEIWQGKGETG
ncbi:hypothetical protein CHS0354_001293, partial [Potamilus streckersoni]